MRHPITLRLRLTPSGRILFFVWMLLSVSAAGASARSADAERGSMEVTSATSSAGLVPDTVRVTDPPRLAAIREFLEEEILFDAYLFPPGRFPGVRWKYPERVERLLGEIPLTVEFVDDTYRLVTAPVRTGRYGAVVRGTTRDGFEVVRYVTLYCCPVEFDDYSPDIPVTIEPLPGYGISPDRWRMYRDDRRRFSFGSLMYFPRHDPDAAVFLAGLNELLPGSRETPRLRDRAWWTGFKRLRDGTAGVSRFPAHNDARQVRHIPFPRGDLYTTAQTRKLREICRSWADSAGVPLTVTILHRGTMAFRGAFGRKADGTLMTTETPTWMASITKLLTGVLVMQFVDAGIVELEASLDRYLPELGPGCPITLRQLLTHTADLSWTGEWASDWNASMENQIRQAIPTISPETGFSYHRAGYALTAKVLERLSGMTVPVLFQRLLFDPLGMSDAIADNTYGGLYSTADELARFGQMLLDHGRRGEVRLLTEKAWQDMLPVPLRGAAGATGRRWGIGCSPQGGKGLSDSTFGHAAASGALLKIDPARSLVIVLGRDAIGPDRHQYDRFTGRFLRAATDPWEKHRD